MKNKFLFLTLFLIIYCFCASAQEIPDPQFSLTPYYIKDNALQTLERADGVAEHKTKALGYGGVELYWSTAGSKSSVRFISTLMPTIVIKTEDNSDPTEVLVVNQADVKKDERRIKSMTAGGFSGLAKQKDYRIKISSKKIRDKLFQVIFDSPLKPGEYAFMKVQDKNATAMQIKLSYFGVD